MDRQPLERAAAAARAPARKDGIGLCLSGGGFRASLFHLGALRRLHETGVLQRVAAISSVSGGSICSAFLATRLHDLGLELSAGFPDWQGQVADPFRRFCGRDFRTWPMVRNILWNFVRPGPLLRQLEGRYRRRLTGLTLGELPARPVFTFCATDLTFGVNWEFTREGAGSYQAGYLAEAVGWPLARAVTASASFPPVLGPMVIRARAADYQRGKYRGADGDRLRRGVELSDGGVYDNMGLEPVWKEWSQVLISDCGAPFEFVAGKTFLRRLVRYTSVVTGQTRALRLRAFFDDTDAGKYGGAYWSLGRGVRPRQEEEPVEGYAGYSEALAEEVLGKVRTDLDRFTGAEMSVLENHGYWSAERAVRRYAPGLVGAGVSGPVSPYPEWEEEGRVREGLRESHRRFSLRRVLTGDRPA